MKIPTPPNQRIVVANLPYDTTEKDLIPLFQPFGEILWAEILRTESGQSRGMAEITYTNAHSAEQATRQHGTQYEGRSLWVQRDKPLPASYQNQA